MLPAGLVRSTPTSVGKRVRGAGAHAALQILRIAHLLVERFMETDCDSARLPSRGDTTRALRSSTDSEIEVPWLRFVRWMLR